MTGIALLVLAGGARGTTWTVCPAGGGCSFTDIQSAIAAASPGDTILVLGGSYGPFLLDKGLFILGVGPSLVTVSTSGSPPSASPARIAGIPAGQFALVAGLRVQIATTYPCSGFCLLCSSSWSSVSAVEVSNCAGAVVLSNLEVNPGHYFRGVLAEGSAVVIADHLLVSATQVTGCGGPFNFYCVYLTACAQPGFQAASTSLSLNDSSILGDSLSTSFQADGPLLALLARSSLLGAGGVSVSCGTISPYNHVGLPGGNGLVAQNGASVRVAGGSGVVIRGGNGGYGTGSVFPVCCPAGSGGHAVSSSTGAAVLLEPGLSLVPGSGYSTSCSTASNGQAISGPGVTTAPAPLPSLGVNPPLVTPGGTVSFSVSGSPGFEYFLGAATVPSFLPIPGVGGPLLLHPSLLIQVASGTLDAVGAASLSIPVPPNPGLSTVFLLFQAATRDPASGAIDLSPAAVVVIL